MHAIAAIRSQHQHWLLTEADAKRYALVWGNVLRHYAVAKTQKAIDHLALMLAIAEFELPRITKEILLQKQAVAPARPAASATVYPIRRDASAGGDGADAP